MARFIRLSQGLKAHRGLRTTAISPELWFLGSCLMRKIATGIRIGLSTTAGWPLSNAAATMMVPPTVTSIPAQKMRLEARALLATEALVPTSPPSTTGRAAPDRLAGIGQFSISIFSEYATDIPEAIVRVVISERRDRLALESIGFQLSTVTAQWTIDD
ncbi:MAG: hypothetical protein LQ339_003291 [Xanthoria mediterranea]|nr:MAG: hypothetical protein LQ339_003291 [Xanthoria mediterranea]